jgi:hypothetical protein
MNPSQIRDLRGGRLQTSGPLNRTGGEKRRTSNIQSNVQAFPGGQPTSKVRGVRQIEDEDENEDEEKQCKEFDKGRDKGLWKVPTPDDKVGDKVLPVGLSPS